MSEKNYKFYKKGFLVLKRKDGQGITIGDGVEVVVQEAKDGKCYLAIKAPGLKVLRSEIVKNEPRKEELGVKIRKEIEKFRKEQKECTKKEKMAQ